MLSTTEIPRLPTELLASVISQFKSEADLVFVWTVVRNVSHSFRDLVDEFVRRRHLPETNIIADISEPQFNTTFSHISTQNPDLAVFTIAPNKDQETRRSITSYRGVNWSHQNEESWARPRAIVAVRRLANDTELPKAHWDVEKCELSFDWRGMFNALLWEEKLRIHLSKQWVQRAKAMKANALANSTSSNVNNAVMKMMIEQRGARDESTARARQKRIQRQIHRTEPQKTWVPDRGDIDAFEALEQVQQVTNGWDFDDT